MSPIANGTLLAIFLLTLPAYADDKPATTVAYRGGTLIDTKTGTAKPNVAIFTRGERIVEIRSGDKVAVRNGQELVDIRGYFVIPGLVNSHVHTATLTVNCIAV